MARVGSVKQFILNDKLQSTSHKHHNFDNLASTENALLFLISVRKIVISF